ncbi:dTDP-4-dehydrorhamnose reductase [Aquimarina amphilecti]|uniref:dTDP-4-dehydrorhamnose reductase n=1 Tax=Aquimarina amphilecti TaxID=1038014 RepID=A0A1H7JVY9_AQUAM|nr:dTDP-4-dehydrorhamnose reductase [Aquimarina amphilecti]SEK77917.1 dTDP-4-dehydrorhamnose reductase [Aquimarina amphilecti]
MKNILITGGKGQLASCIKDRENHIKNYNFLYVDYDELDITSEKEVVTFFEINDIAYCINCAAYTAVDKAESEIDLATRVNELGVSNLVKSCKSSNAVFIQISTDFVFEGSQSIPYTEEDNTNPIGIYGLTKLKGEKAALSLEKHFILRTSWLYSEHGNNFMKTMIRLGKEKDQLNVVCDQIGTPTYAGDLADFILKLIIGKSSKAFGLYHYSNEGVASWYDFAKAIFQESNTSIKVLPINTEAYPTPAKRPSFSVMDKIKIKEVFKIEIPYWRDSLRKCLGK